MCIEIVFYPAQVPVQGSYINVVYIKKNWLKNQNFGENSKFW